MAGALERAERRGNGGIGICSRGGYNVGGEGRVITAAVLCVEHESKVKGAGLGLREASVGAEHIKQVLRRGKLGLGRMDIKALALIILPV